MQQSNKHLSSLTGSHDAKWFGALVVLRKWQIAVFGAFCGAWTGVPSAKAYSLRASRGYNSKSEAARIDGALIVSRVLESGHRCDHCSRVFGRNLLVEFCPFLHLEVLELCPL